MWILSKYLSDAWATHWTSHFQNINENRNSIKSTKDYLICYDHWFQQDESIKNFPYTQISASSLIRVSTHVGRVPSCFFQTCVSQALDMLFVCLIAPRCAVLVSFTLLLLLRCLLTLYICLCKDCMALVTFLITYTAGVLKPSIEAAYFLAYSCLLLKAFSFC